MPNVQPHARYFQLRFALVLVAAAAAAAIVIAAISVHRSISLGTAATARPASHSSPLTLTERVLPPSALPDFISMGRPAVVHSASSWATSAERSPRPALETQRLNRLGFVGGVDEHLQGRFPLAAEAISVVERYRSAAGARAELAYQRRSTLASAIDGGQRIMPFGGIAIPGGFGWVARTRSVTGINVMFTSGSYYYLVGSGAAPGAHGAPTPAQIVAAAQVVNLLVNGCTSRTAVPQHRQPHAALSRRGGQTLLLH